MQDFMGDFGKNFRGLVEFLFVWFLLTHDEEFDRSFDEESEVWFQEEFDGLSWFE